MDRRRMDWMNGLSEENCPQKKNDRGYRSDDATDYLKNMRQREKILLCIHNT